MHQAPDRKLQLFFSPGRRRREGRKEGEEAGNGEADDGETEGSSEDRQRCENRTRIRFVTDPCFQPYPSSHSPPQT